MNKSSKEQKKSTKAYTPSYVSEFEELVKDDVSRLGFEVTDSRFKRTVMNLSGHFVVIKDPKLLKFYRNNTVLKKYKDDWRRMANSFTDAVREAKKDKYSRQLMVFNNEDYKNVHQCFTSFQFMMTARKEYDLYVYQRSADMIKFRDDITFFADIANKFSQKTSTKVTKIVVIYGSIHFETVF